MKRLDYVFAQNRTVLALCFAFTITLMMISPPVVFAQEDSPGKGPASKDHGPPESKGKPDAGPPDEKGPPVEGEDPPGVKEDPEDEDLPDDDLLDDEGAPGKDHGPPEFRGKPEGVGKPEGAGKPEDTSRADDDFFDESKVLRPMQQISQGVTPQDVTCKDDLQKLFKYDGSPVCVSESSVEKLIARGWVQ